MTDLDETRVVTFDTESENSSDSDQEDVKKKGKPTVKDPKLGLVKPNYVTDRKKEVELNKIATRGVTQLFNAVSERQKFMNEKMEEIEKADKRKDKRQIVEEIKSTDFMHNLHAAKKTKVETKEESDDSADS